jgi:hypothetical protein
LAPAASEAGISRWEIMDHVKSKKINAQYELEDFQRDRKTIAPGKRQ